MAREASHRRTCARYRIRQSGPAIVLRHLSPDLVIMNEIFRERIYALPSEVARRLQSAQSPSILDLGANIGMFAASIMTEYPAAQVIAVEPDPANLPLLRRVLQVNAMHSRCKVVPAAAGTSVGHAPFVGGLYGGSHIADDWYEGTSTIAVEDVFDLTPGVDLLKMDIEGAEWPILLDPRFRSLVIPTIVMEYHPGAAPAADARGAAWSLLEEASYTVSDVATSAPTGHGTLWAIRDEPPVSA